MDFEIKPMFNLAPEIQTSVPHYKEDHISRFIYCNPSVVKATLFHFFHKHRSTCYKIRKDTKVYFYLITSKNEKYSKFKQVGFTTIDRNKVQSTAVVESQELMAKAFDT